MKGLILHYIGSRTEPVKMKNILAHLEACGIKTSNRLVRETIDEMIIVDGHNIRSSGKGYSLIETDKDYEATIKYLNSYIFSLLERRRAIKRNYLKQTAKLYQ